MSRNATGATSSATLVTICLTFCTMHLLDTPGPAQCSTALCFYPTALSPHLHPRTSLSGTP